jgi:FAD/FMN-containing dehydrogenase
LQSLPYITLDKVVRQLRQSDATALAAQISGGALGPDDDGYDEARKVWNATVDRRPTLIARCLTTSDVQAAVRFATAHRMLLSVRGGGRSDDRPVGHARGQRQR